MIGFPKTPPLRWGVLALGFLAVATAGADAAPLRYNITDLGWVSGKGLDNDGRVIAEPIRNIVSEYVPDYSEFAGDFPSVVDGTADGRLLVNTIGKRGTPLYNSSFAHVYRPSELWGGSYTQLGTADGMWRGEHWNRIQGVDMNEKGDVVGQIVGALWADGYESNPERPFLVSAGTTKIQELIDLLPPDSGWRPTDVYSINDVGQILGWGVNPEGHYTTFLMTPADNVPEPGTWAVFGLAAAAFAWRNRRRAA